MRTIQKRYRDSQRAVPAGECARCGAELYPGCIGWQLCGRILCGDCVGPWLLEQLSSCRVSLGEVGR